MFEKIRTAITALFRRQPEPPQIIDRPQATPVTEQQLLRIQEVRRDVAAIAHRMRLDSNETTALIASAIKETRLNPDKTPDEIGDRATMTAQQLAASRSRPVPPTGSAQTNINIVKIPRNRFQRIKGNPPTLITGDHRHV